jgi:hypothetical protein
MVKNMILFKEDLLTHKCIIDYNTSNKSFLKMSMVLKKMGVKNHLFMLALSQPELVGVDPHSPNLTSEQEHRIAYEAKTNPWYFFRECLRVPSQGGEPVPYELHRANMALIWCFFNSVDTYLTMPRQKGKTVGALGLITGATYITGSNSNIAMFTKDADLRTENVRRIKALRDGIPSFMVMSGNAANSNNQESVEYKPTNCKLLTFVAQSDSKRAAKQGRGESFLWSMWDELAYYENNHLSYPSAIAASEKVGADARKKGIPTATLITTTAGYTSTEAGKYAYNMKSRSLRFSERLYDCTNNQQLREMVEVGGSSGFVYLEYSYKQLGEDDEWLKKVSKNKPPEVIAVDYLNKWIHGSGESVLPKKMLDLLEAGIEEPISVTIEENILMRWYADQGELDKPANKNIPYILASDTSDNIGKDFTTLVLLNPIDMAVVMTCRCNQSNMVYIAKLIFKLMERFPRLIFIPERNRAATLLDVLLHMISNMTNWDPFKRIYNSYVQDIGGSTDFRKLDIQLGSVRKAFGFTTSGAKDSRRLLYSNVLITVAERNHQRIFDSQIVNEICDLVVRDGRVDHSISGNDDTLVAYLIACWFIMYGKNTELYGINPEEIMSQGAPEDSQFDPRQIEYRKRYAYLKEKLESNYVSQMMRQAFENELRELGRLLKDSAEIPNSAISLHEVDKIHESNQPPITTDAIKHQLMAIQF